MLQNSASLKFKNRIQSPSFQPFKLLSKFFSELNGLLSKEARGTFAFTIASFYLLKVSHNLVSCTEVSRLTLSLFRQSSFDRKSMKYLTSEVML